MASGPKWNPQRGTWYVQYWQGTWRRKTVAQADRRKWRPGDPEPSRIPPEAHAELVRLREVERMARERQSRGLPTSLREFLEEHIATYRNPRTRATAEPVIRGFLGWCEGQGVVRYDQVTAKVCKAWIRHLAATLSLATVSTHRGYVAAAWGRQVKEDEIDKSPWSKVKPEGEDRAKPRDSWTKDEFEQILAHCDDWLRDILILGVNTGLRIRALLAIEWDHWLRPQSDLDRYGYIRVPKQLDKVGRGYKVPVSRELHDLLNRRFGKFDPHFIVVGQQGRPIRHRNHVAKSIVRACERAGLPTPRSPNHHMRRTFGRWAVLGHLTGQPVPLYVASRWLGHHDPKTTLRYLDVTEEESARWMTPQGFDAPTNPPAADSATPHPATSRYPRTGDSGDVARSGD